VTGIALLGFTLAYGEFACMLLTAGSSNALRLEIFGMITSVTTLVLHAPGTLTTLSSFAGIVCPLVVVRVVAAKRGA
jgi:putative spermidine/putrescine transport system permease protein